MADNIELLARPTEHRENRKKNRGRKVGDDQAMAVTKFVRVPARKARLVVDEVRGQYVADAMAFLRYVPNRAAVFIAKTLQSAAANAVNNHGLTFERLKLVEARIDEGPRLKRVQPRAQGRAYRILKRMSHITIIVQEVEPKPRKPKKVVTGTRAQAARAARQTAAAPAVTAPVEAEELTTARVEEMAAAETAPVVENTAEQTAPAAENTAAVEETAAAEEASAAETNEGGAEAPAEE